jgi:hypothetical protein
MRCWGRVVYCAGIAAWFVLLLNVTCRPAYAYVDPGSGLLFIQVIGSTFAGITFLLRKKIRELFGRFTRQSAKADSDFVPD